MLGMLDTSNRYAWGVFVGKKTWEEGTRRPVVHANNSLIQAAVSVHTLKEVAMLDIKGLEQAAVKHRNAPTRGDLL